MNAIEKQRHAQHLKILTLAARIRVMRLDEDRPDETPDEVEAAKALVEAHTEAEINESMNLALYMGQIADKDCECGGKGAKVMYVSPVVSGTEAAPPTDLPMRAIYSICDCVRKNDAKRRAAGPAFISQSKPPSDIDLQVTKAEGVLKDAKAAQAKACAKTDQQISEIAGKVAAFEEERKRLTVAIEAAQYEKTAIERVLGSSQHILLSKIAALRAEIEQLLAAVRATQTEGEAKIAEAEGVIAYRETDLDKYLDEHGELTIRHTALTEGRTKIAARHEPKIRRAERRLKRLKYLRGDSGTVDLGETGTEGKDVDIQAGGRGMTDAEVKAAYPEQYAEAVAKVESDKPSIISCTDDGCSASDEPYEMMAIVHRGRCPLALDSEHTGHPHEAVK